MLSKLKLTINHSWPENMLSKLNIHSWQENCHQKKKKKNPDLIIFHLVRRTKLVSYPCNNSTIRLITKFIQFYVILEIIFLMPIVKFVSFQTCHVTKTFKYFGPSWIKWLNENNPKLTQCKAYQSHLAASSFLAEDL